MATSRLTMKSLVACIEYHRPEARGSISLAPVPSGRFNDSYYVLAAGEELVLRVAPPSDSVFVFYERGMMRQEPAIHDLLLKHTTVPVPRIVAFDDSRKIVDRDFLLMERLPGLPVCDLGELDEGLILRQIGEALAQVHTITSDSYGYLGKHSPMPPQESWPEAFAVMWRGLVDDVVNVGYYDQEESALMLHTLDRFLHLFDRQVPASLLHMDVWAQNILVDSNSRLTGLLDWDRALWGDPEIEFAVLDYCGISSPEFWEGYGTPREESPETTIRSFFYLLYEVQKYIVIRHGRHNDPHGANEYKGQVMEIIRRIQREAP